MDSDEAEITRFFVPETCVGRLGDLTGVEVTLTTIHEFGLGFFLKGLILRGRRDRLRPKLESMGFVKTAIGYTPTMVMCAVYSVPGSLASPSPTDLPLAFKESHPRFVADFLEPFELLANITGLDVSLHLPDSLSFPILPARKNGLDIVVGACPPGEIRQEQVGNVCGVQVAPYGQAYRFYTHTVGYGRIVKDTDNSCVLGQIVNKMLYIPLRTDVKEILPSYAKAGGYLIFKCLEKVWKEYVKETIPEEVGKTLSSPKECSEFLLAQRVEALHAFEDRLRIREEEVEQALTKYNDAVHSLRVGRMLVAGMRAKIDVKTVEAVVDHSWDDMFADPRIAKIEVVSEMYQITTSPIIFTDGVVKRPLGSFGIRFSGDGDVFIWSIDSPHPRRVPHPHISICGAKCFGNVGPMITDLITELNIPGAVRMILDWLEDGYDPQLADVKIEEWPILKEAR